MDKRLYELREVAEATGMRLGTVRQYASRGVIPIIKIGAKCLVRADVLETICAQGLATKKQAKKTKSARHE